MAGLKIAPRSLELDKESSEAEARHLAHAREGALGKQQTPSPGTA